MMSDLEGGPSRTSKRSRNSPTAPTCPSQSSNEITPLSANRDRAHWSWSAIAAGTSYRALRDFHEYHFLAMVYLLSSGLRIPRAHPMVPRPADRRQVRPIFGWFGVL